MAPSHARLTLMTVSIGANYYGVEEHARRACGHARNHAYHQFHFKISRCCIEPLDIGGSMGTVLRQDSVPNGSMQYQELFKWHC